MKWVRATATFTEVILVTLLLGLVSISVLYSLWTEDLGKNTIELELDVAALESKPPEMVDLRDQMSAAAIEIKLNNTIQEILGDQVGNYGIYIKDLKTGKEYGVNPDQVFSPASISKLPYGILALKYIDDGKLSYYDTLVLEERHKFYKTDPLYEFPNGSSWAIADLIRLLLVDSDNVPMAMLEEYFGGVDNFNKQAESIGVGGLTRYPHETTPRAVGNIFEKIYRAELLSPESNDVLITHLSKYKVFRSDRIRLGVARAGGNGNDVVHKIGNLDGIYQDSGYVRSPGGDFIIVTLNQNRTSGEAVNEITAVTEAVYKHFNQSQ